MKHFTLTLLLIVFLLVPTLVFSQSDTQAGDLSAEQKLEEDRIPDQDYEECQREEGQDLLSEDGGSGSYVPVHEVGNLLSVTRQGTALSFEICRYLKVLKRIQYEFEEKVFVQDADARKAAAREIFEHKQSYIDETVKKGYEVSSGVLDTVGEGGGEAGQDGQPLYVTNTNQHVNDAEKEAYGVLRYDLENSENIFKQEINRDLAERQATAGQEQLAFTERTRSSLSRAEYEQFSNDFAQGGWRAWLLMAQPQNNPIGSRILAEQELSVRQAKARSNAYTEIASGQGFLPVRECLTKVNTSDGKEFCRTWKTKTPASINQNYLSQVLTSTLRQNEQADQILEDFSKDEFVRTEAELRNVGESGSSGDVRSAAPSIFESEEEPCPGPGPCEDSGWSGTAGAGNGTGNTGGGQINVGGFGDGNNDGIPDFYARNEGLFDQELQSQINALRGQNLDPRELLQQITRLIRDYEDQRQRPPKVVMNVRVPPASEVDNNTAVISWEVLNAQSCRTENTWYYRGESENFVAKDRGATLSKNGSSLSIDLPIRFNLQMTQAGQGDINEPPCSPAGSPRLTSQTDPLQLRRIYTLQLGTIGSANYSCWENDHTLSFTDTGTNLSLPQSPSTYRSPSELIAFIRETVNSLSNNNDRDESETLKQFEFTYDTTDTNTGPARNIGSMTVTVKPVYKMSCTNAHGRTLKEVELTRSP